QPVLVGAGNPIPSDHRDQRVAGTDPFGQYVEPINAEVDIVEIEEDVFALQALRHAVKDRACRQRGLFASIANEDAAQHLYAPRTARKLARKVPSFNSSWIFAARCDPRHIPMALRFNRGRRDGTSGATRITDRPDQTVDQAGRVQEQVYTL